MPAGEFFYNMYMYRLPSVHIVKEFYVYVGFYSARKFGKLKVHKNGKFFGSDFDCVIFHSLLCLNIKVL
jgi:hypothetical protein